MAADALPTCAAELRDDLRDVTLRRRLAAIWFCLWYGVRPWWMYERVKHHRGGYLDHLKVNLVYAWRWLRWRESDADRAYEADVNGAHGMRALGQTGEARHDG